MQILPESLVGVGMLTGNPSNRYSAGEQEKYARSFFLGKEEKC